MRTLASKDKIEEFMERFGNAARTDSHVYLTGGASAVLLGWRDSTVDVDISFAAENDDLLRIVPKIKEELHLNVELASPPDFIPALPGWETRSPFIDRKGKASFYHFDFYSQALSKIERSHSQDLLDVRAMLDLGLIAREKLWEMFSAIEPQLYKYPAINPARFARSVTELAND
jgi:hypothetical protein